MQKIPPNFSMEEAMAFAKSPEGQRLYAMLQSSNHPNIQKAMDAVSKGNMDQAASLLQHLSEDPQFKNLTGRG